MTKEQNKQLEFARAYFREAHDSIEQKRRYTNEPYWHHTEAVEAAYAEIFPDCLVGRIAALGHDFKEDVLMSEKCPDKYNFRSVFEIFGKDVDDVINGLTDVYTTKAFPDFNREKRHKLEAERIGSYAKHPLGCIVHTVKCFDLSNNTAGDSSIVKHDKKFAAVYIPEKEAVLRVLTAAHRLALADAWNKLNWGYEELAKV